MPSKINQLIDALAGALRDFDAGLGSMPREEIADALALADAADEEHRAQVRELRADVEAAQGQAEHDEHRGWLKGYEHNGVERRQMCDERNDARADGERVRRGARCLRERCRRLESRARGVERRLALVNAAYWYATRLNDEMVAITPSSLSMARARLAVRYGDRTMVKAGELALKMLDVLAAGGSLAGIVGGTDERD